jgi:hypothetical protein
MGPLEALDGRIILKGTSKKYGKIVWNGFNWLKIKFIGGFS